ncbi:hypothetical protein [Oceaniovalibus sp. ACAM 378]|uniref:hypothetical protein n=1 Tax=Oceaniovalibus sp. ACAM 378 TaxID=2599923 RepID=UPI0011DC6CFA|nr:hypothetical protein [Oceaniovalibus sp. ACAM 378]TYB84315.1 hypothetical protein FQ320_22230 [Oceaniovalibus sp. ACAM 378]
MKMSSFEYQMTKLDHLVLEADAANTRRAAQRQIRLEASNETKSGPETTSLEDDSLLLNNVPI